MTKPLTGRFVRDGFVKLTGAVPLPVVEACVDLLWEAIGLDRHDPSTWTQPVYWVGGMSQPPFVQAMNSVVLLEACDELAGREVEAAEFDGELSPAISSRRRATWSWMARRGQLHAGGQRHPVDQPDIA